MNKLDSSASEFRDKAQLFLFISLGWCGLSLLALLIAAFSDTTSAKIQISLAELLLAFLALYGLSLFRWQSLKPLLSGEPQTEPNTTSGNSLNLNSSITSFFGNDPKLRISWLAQTLGNLSLAVTLLSTWNPAILAGLVAAILVGIEFAWSFSRLHAQQIGGNVRNSTLPADKSSQPESLKKAETPQAVTVESKATTTEMKSIEPTLRSSNTAAIANTLELDEEIDGVDPSYETLMALRDKIEIPRESDEPLPENAPHSDAIADESAPVPLQAQRDYRDKAGMGRIAGELNILTKETTTPWIYTIGFMPPFKSMPEWIAECDSDADVNIKVLQIQPVGVKLEVKPNPKSELPEQLTIHWEAALEST